MQQADLGPVARIEQEYPSPWTSAMIADELEHSNSLMLVAMDKNGLVLGWCSARYLLDEAELFKIAVNPEQKRVGVGSFLFFHLEKILFRHNVETLFLEVRSLNHSALSFYSKHGFAEIGMRVDYYTNPRDNALILKKLIT